MTSHVYAPAHAVVPATPPRKRVVITDTADSANPKARRLIPIPQRPKIAIRAGPTRSMNKKGGSVPTIPPTQKADVIQPPMLADR